MTLCHSPGKAQGETAPENGLPALRQIYFYLTEGCNCACRHCWIAPKFDPQASHPMLPVRLFETAILEAKPLGLQGVKLTGGEPLMHPRFAELLEIVRREKLALTIETNGMLCTPEIVKEITSFGHASISVSLDGVDAKTHDWVRGGAGSFEMAQQGVRNLVDGGIRPQIIMTLMRRNVGQAEAVVRMAEELGASSVKFNLLQPIARGEALDMQGESLGIRELIDLGRYMESEVAKRSSLRIFYDYPPAFRLLSRMARGDGCGRCSILNIIGVIASGQYALCGIGYSVPELVFGTVGKDRLGDIWWSNSVLKSLREGLPERLGGVCQQCLMKRVCLGSCVAQNFYRSRDLWSSSWFCEDAYAEGFFPRSRMRDDKEGMNNGEDRDEVEQATEI